MDSRIAPPFVRALAMGGHRDRGEQLSSPTSKPRNELYFDI